MTHIFFFAGEMSGDVYGGLLLGALKKNIPQLIATGVGGPEMRAQGLAGGLSMEDFEVMGFSDVMRSLPRLRNQFNHLRQYILDTEPEIVVFIDSPAFSLRMAASLRKKGFRGKLVQYICPSVWAYGAHRAQQMAASFDLLLTIFPFEAAYFKSIDLAVKYVGHPLLESMQNHRYDSDWQKLFRIRSTSDLIALFPGSRPSEVRRNLPQQLAAAHLLKQAHPQAIFAISCAQERNMEVVQTILSKGQFKHNRDVFFVPRDYTFDLMKSCRSAIAKSGTVTLELAMHGCPTVVMYELTRLNYWIAKFILRVNLPHYCIVNILAKKAVFPELIEKGNTPETLFHQLKALHTESDARQNCLRGCQELKDLFPSGSPSERAASAIVELF